MQNVRTSLFAFGSTSCMSKLTIASKYITQEGVLERARDYSTMSLPPCPPPKSLLGRHRLLAPTASVYVSPICLGGLNFGEAWKDILGTCSKETAFEILDYFYEQGGNFIDT